MTPPVYTTPVARRCWVQDGLQREPKTPRPSGLGRIDERVLLLADAGESLGWSLLVDGEEEAAGTVSWTGEARDQWVEETLFAQAALFATVAGWNLPAILGRLALRASEGKVQDTVSLLLQEGDWQPRVRVKPLTATASLLEWTNSKHGRGRFVDLRTLADALVRGEGQDDGERQDPEEASWLRATAVAVNRWRSLRAVYDRFPWATWDEADPRATPIIRLFSAASVAKAYLRWIGYRPPEVSDYLNGVAMSCFFGGRIETALRLEKAEAHLVDFTSQYPAVFCLLDLWPLATAQKIVSEEVTAAARSILNTIAASPTVLFERNLWPSLTGYARLKPGGDLLPIRAPLAAGAEGDLSRCHTPLAFVQSDEDHWWALPDLAASAALTGKAPQIEEAIWLLPSGSQALSDTVAIGGMEVDTNDGDLFARIVEARKALEQGPEPGMRAALEAREAWWRSRRADDGPQGLARKVARLRDILADLEALEESGEPVTLSAVAAIVDPVSFRLMGVEACTFPYAGEGVEVMPSEVARRLLQEAEASLEAATAWTPSPQWEEAAEGPADRNREGEAAAIKLLANSASYGIWVEFSEVELAEGDGRMMEFWTGEEFPKRRPRRQYDRPGAYCCPVIGSLVTAGGRLLLALLQATTQRQRAARGMAEGPAYAWAATDAMALLGLQDSDLDALQDQFNRLSPYDRNLIPQFLRVEDRGTVYAVAGARYCLRSHVGGKGKLSRHGLSGIVPPVGYSAAAFADRFWQAVMLEDAPTEWNVTPVIRKAPARTLEGWRRAAAVARGLPFGGDLLFICATGDEGAVEHTFYWHGGRWWHAETGEEAVLVGACFIRGREMYVAETLSDLVLCHHSEPELKMIGAGGRWPTIFDEGPLYPRRFRLKGSYLVGKETDRLIGSERQPGERHAVNVLEECGAMSPYWWRVVDELGAWCGPVEVCRVAGISDRSWRRIRSGEKRPSPETFRALWALWRDCSRKGVDRAA